MNVNQALNEFLEEKRSQGRATATVLFHRRLLTPFVIFLEGRDRTDVAGLGNPDMRAFFGQLYARNEAGEITKATVAAYDRSVRAFCSFCVQEKLLLENPMKGRPRARAPRGLPDTLTFAEIHALLNACDEDPLGRRDRALMLFMLDTGLRAGEVCALTAADLFLAGDHGRVRVRAETSKDREERTVPVSAETVKALRRYLEDRPAQAQALFVSVAAGTHKLSADRLSGSGLNQLMRRRGEQADVVGKRKWCHICGIPLARTMCSPAATWRPSAGSWVTPAWKPCASTWVFAPRKWRRAISSTRRCASWWPIPETVQPFTLNQWV